MAARTRPRALGQFRACVYPFLESIFMFGWRQSHVHHISMKEGDGDGEKPFTAPYLYRHLHSAALTEAVHDAVSEMRLGSGSAVRGRIFNADHN